MPKTLADYSQDARHALVGMWCDVEGEDNPVVLVRYTSLSYAVLYRPSDLYQYHALISRVTPLLDQPRAWQADGTPVKGRWETAERIDDDPDFKKVFDLTSEKITHRRYLTAWEPIPEDQQ